VPDQSSGGSASAPRRSYHRKAGRPPAGAKSASAAEIIKPLKGVLILLTLALGLLLCGFNLEDPLVEFIMLDDTKAEGQEQSEAQAIAQPLANILTRQKWFAAWGQGLVDSEDGIALAWGAIIWAGRVFPAVRQRMAERPVRERHRQAARAGAGSAQPSSGANGHQPATGWNGLSGAYTADAL
jgi:hypothetical protein